MFVGATELSVGRVVDKLFKQSTTTPLGECPCGPPVVFSALQWRRFVSKCPRTKAVEVVCLTATEKNQIDAVLAPSREASVQSNSDRMGSAHRC